MWNLIKLDLCNRKKCLDSSAQTDQLTVTALVDRSKVLAFED